MSKRFVATVLAVSFLAACGGSEDTSTGRIKNAALDTSTTVKKRGGKLKSTTTVAITASPTDAMLPPTTLLADPITTTPLTTTVPPTTSTPPATTAPPRTIPTPTTPAAPRPQSTVAPAASWKIRQVSEAQILELTRYPTVTCSGSGAMSIGHNPSKPNVVGWNSYSSQMSRYDDPLIYPVIEMSTDRRTWHKAPYLQDSPTSAKVLLPTGVRIVSPYFVRMMLLIPQPRCMTSISNIVIVQP